jgi:hypothetical protein
LLPINASTTGYNTPRRTANAERLKTPSSLFLNRDAATGRKEIEMLTPTAPCYDWPSSLQCRFHAWYHAGAIGAMQEEGDMPRGQQSRGTCAFCGYETTKGSMSKHLASCPQRQARSGSTATKKQSPQPLFHLRAQDAYNSDFWLDLEVSGSAQLKAIDSYLRAIWLECCGHLSEFTAGGWGGTKFAKTRLVQDVFGRTPVVTHIYDFGTSSETQLKMMGQREGAPLTKHPITLLARNQMPEAVCIECGKPATFFCMECMIENDSPGMLCTQHAENHPHEDYGEPIALVNSPRLGMCGYTGPADPPY